jgi:hypothetical protein
MTIPVQPEHSISERQDRGSEVDALEREITTLAAHINAATYRLLRLIAEFDRREGWTGWGILSCAHWLNWKCGIGLNAAREKVRVAGALRFTRPDGRPIVQAGDVTAVTRGSVPGLMAANREAGLAIDQGTVECLWDGARLDLGMGVDGLLGCDGRL